ncbi:MAG: hypothetical protein H8E71_04135 [Candidatus Marinimicrobia bacterium]|nr:hypothetical protein [Candidatus Neomarinimicrobiota bacterium]
MTVKITLQIAIIILLLSLTTGQSDQVLIERDKIDKFCLGHYIMGNFAQIIEKTEDNYKNHNLNQEWRLYNKIWCAKAHYCIGAIEKALELEMEIKNEIILKHSYEFDEILVCKDYNKDQSCFCNILDVPLYSNLNCLNEDNLKGFRDYNIRFKGFKLESAQELVNTKELNKKDVVQNTIDYQIIIPSLSYDEFEPTSEEIKDITMSNDENKIKDVENKFCKINRLLIINQKESSFILNREYENLGYVMVIKYLPEIFEKYLVIDKKYKYLIEDKSNELEVYWDSDWTLIPFIERDKLYLYFPYSSEPSYIDIYNSKSAYEIKVEDWEDIMTIGQEYDEKFELKKMKLSQISTWPKYDESQFGYNAELIDTISLIQIKVKGVDEMENNLELKLSDNYNQYEVEEQKGKISKIFLYLCVTIFGISVFVTV